MLDNRRIAARTLGCLLLCCVAASGQYGGPSLLSRGGTTPGARGRSPVDFTYYGGARAMYESGLLLAQTDEEGTIRPTSGWGQMFEGGLYGGKAFRRSSFGVDYRADYRRQPSRRTLNGLSQTLGMQYQNQIRRRVTVFTAVNAGVMQRAFGVFAIPVTAGPADFGVPLNEVFDNRTLFGQVAAGASWQKSARLTYSGTGSAFFAKRRSTDLFNSQGSNGSLSASYRSSLRTSWTLGYEYTRMWFPSAFSNVGAHSPVIGVNHKLTQSLTAVLSGGYVFAALTGVERVQLSPLVAAILGRTTGTQAFERRVNFANYAGSLQYVTERSRSSFGFSSGMNAGNGLFRASRRTQFGGGHSYSGIRKLSLAASGSYSTMSSIGESLPSLKTRAIGGSAYYVLAEHLQLTSQYDYRWFETSLIRTRKGQFFSIGLSLTPSRLPLAIW